MAGKKRFRPTPRVEGLPPELEKREAKPLSHPIQASPTANFPTAKSLDLGAVPENSCRRLGEVPLRLWEDAEEGAPAGGAPHEDSGGIGGGDALS